jgi:hypothetical protein
MSETFLGSGADDLSVHSDEILSTNSVLSGQVAGIHLRDALVIIHDSDLPFFRSPSPNFPICAALSAQPARYSEAMAIATFPRAMASFFRVIRSRLGPSSTYKLRIFSQCAMVIEGIQAAVILVLGSLHRGDLL